MLTPPPVNKSEKQIADKYGYNRPREFINFLTHFLMRPACLLRHFSVKKNRHNLPVSEPQNIYNVLNLILIKAIYSTHTL